MSVVNTNIASLTAQNAMKSANAALTTSIERLTTGQKINSAADDAAGLAISSRMDSQIRGLETAVKNIGDTTALAQTAEGAIVEMNNILQKMRELTLQSYNGTNTSQDREALNTEFTLLMSELDRVAETTSFNNQKILDGTLNSSAQVGAFAGEVIDFSIRSMRVDDMGFGASSIGGNNTLVGARIGDIQNIGGGDIRINKQEIGELSEGDDITDLVQMINDSVDNVEASAFNVVKAKYVGDGVTNDGDFQITMRAAGSSTDTVFNISASNNMEELVNNINNEAGAFVHASLDSEGKLELANDTGLSITVQDNSAGAGNYDGGSGFGGTSTTFNGFLRLNSKDGSDIRIERGNVGLETAGTMGDLEAIGFREIGRSSINDKYTVTGGAISSTGTEWKLGDIAINGVDIYDESIDTSTIAGRISMINNFSSETGVTAKSSLEVGLSTSDLKFGSTELLHNISMRDADFSSSYAAASFDVSHLSEYDNLSDTSLEISGVSVSGSNTAEGLVENINLAMNRANYDLTASLSEDGTQVILKSSQDITFAENTWIEQPSGAISSGGTDWTAIAAGDSRISINGTEVTLGDTAEESATAINTEFANGSVVASVDSDGNLILSSEADITVENGGGDANVLERLMNETNRTSQGGFDFTSLSAGDAISINGTDVDLGSATSIADVASAINGTFGNGSVVASVSEDGNLELSSSSAIIIGDDTGGSGIAASMFGDYTLTFGETEAHTDTAKITFGALDTVAVSGAAFTINGHDVQAGSDVASTVDAINAMFEANDIDMQATADPAKRAISVDNVDFSQFGDNSIVNINGVDVVLGDSAQSTVSAINAAFENVTGSTKVEASINDDGEIELSSSLSVVMTNGSGDAGTLEKFMGVTTRSSQESYDFSSGFSSGDGIVVNGTEIDLSTATDANSVATAINGAFSDGSVRATVSEDGNLQLSSDSALVIEGNGTSVASSMFGDYTNAFSSEGISFQSDTVDSLDIRGSELDSAGVTDLFGGYVSASAAPNSIVINNTEIMLGDTAAESVTAIRDAMSKASMDIDVQIEGSNFILKSESMHAVSIGVKRGTSDNYEVETHMASLRLDDVDNKPISIELGSNADISTHGLMEMNVGAADFDQNKATFGTAGGESLSSVKIDTAEGAESAIGVIDAALESVSNVRIELGALQNRLDHTANNLTSVIKNTQSARSNIMDADFAVETAKMTKAQILSQASAAMLSQANQLPQAALQLLQG